MRTLIKIVVGSNITVLYLKKYDHVRNEYGEIINASEISNGDDAIADVWNEYNFNKFLVENEVNIKTVLLFMIIES